MRILSALLLIVLLETTIASYSGQAARTRCWSSGNGRSAKWWNEGERVDRGKYWYECHRGQLSPKGCFTDKGKRLSIGESFDNGGYINTCVLGDNDYLEFKYTACVDSDGKVRQAGEEWTDPKNTYYYKCTKDGRFLQLKVDACVSHDKQKKIKLGQSYDHGDYTYECKQKYDGIVQMCSVGCVHNGKHYKIGEQWPEGDYIFYCKNNGGKCQKKCIGCVYQNKNLYDGDRYRKEHTVYQCEIRQTSYGHRPVGCISRETDGTAVERVIGCRWYLSTYESKIEQTCELEGEKTQVNTVGCIYRYRGYDTLFVNPGSYTIWNLPKEKKALGVACRKQGESAFLETFELSELTSRTMGLKYDQPRG